MINKKFILEKCTKIEDKLLLAKILDKAAYAEKHWKLAYSDFLDPYQIKMVGSILSGCNEINYRFDGGYNSAERAIVVFDPEFIYKDYDNDGENLLRLINIEVKSNDQLSAQLK